MLAAVAAAGDGGVRMEQKAEQKGRCVHCRTDVIVPATYDEGDHIKCGACDTGHRVVRVNNVLRLVIADVTPLRETLRQNEQRLRNLEAELKDARASFGIGSLGIGVGVIYLLVKVAWENAAITAGM